LALQIDLYIIDAWRLENANGGYLHYQDTNLSKIKFAQIIYMMAVMLLAKDAHILVEAYEKYGRHLNLPVAVIALGVTG